MIPIFERRIIIKKEKKVMAMITFIIILFNIIVMISLSNMSSAIFRERQSIMFYGKNGISNKYSSSDVKTLLLNLEKEREILSNTIVTVEYAQNFFNIPEASIIILWGDDNTLFQYPLLSGEYIDFTSNDLQIQVGKKINKKTTKIQNNCSLFELECEVKGIVGEKGINGMFDDMFIVNGKGISNEFIKYVPAGKMAEVTIQGDNESNISKLISTLGLTKNSELNLIKNSDSEFYSKNFIQILAKLTYKIYFILLITFIFMSLHLSKRNAYKYTVMKLFHASNLNLVKEIVLENTVILLFTLAITVVFHETFTYFDSNYIGRIIPRMYGVYLFQDIFLLMFITLLSFFRMYKIAPNRIMKGEDSLW